MPNDDFVSLVETSDKWITKRTGIRRRHMIAKSDSNQNSGLRDIASQSGIAALENAGVDPKEIDLVIVATSSPDDLFGDAASVASAVGATNAAAFDITAACSGFLYGMVTASQFMHSGAYQKVLVVGADALTRFLDWSGKNNNTDLKYCLNRHLHMYLHVYIYIYIYIYHVLTRDSIMSRSRHLHIVW